MSLPGLLRTLRNYLEPSLSLSHSFLIPSIGLRTTDTYHGCGGQQNALSLS